MCCLVYEEAFYREHRKLLPKIGKRVMTPHGEGRVRDVDVLKQTARIELADPAAPSRIVELKATDLQPIQPPPGAPGAPREEPEEAEEPDDAATKEETPQT
jgi:cell fate regulator YaaT (PSP1 superfamily)